MTTRATPLAVAAALLVLVGCGPRPADGTGADRQPVPPPPATASPPATVPPPATAAVLELPSNGTGPNDLVMQAQLMGPLHVSRSASGACAWLGTTPSAALWPAGYRVRFSEPAELLDPQGRTVAREGQRLTAGGGMGTVPRSFRCSVGPAQDASYIQANVQLG